MRKSVFYSLLVFGLLLNALVKPIAQWHFGNSEIANSIFGIQPGIFVCVLLGIYSLTGSFCSHQANVSRFDLLVAIFVTSLSLLPFAKLSWLALLVASFSGLVSTRKQELFAFKTAMVIFIAIAMRDALSTLMMDIFASPLLSFDALMVARLYSLLGLQATAELNMIVRPHDHVVYVMTGCASFKDISIGVLVWFCLVRLQSEKLIPFWIIGSCLVAGAIFFSNILRLALMSVSADHYVFYHEGPGTFLFQGVFLIVILLSTFLGDRYARI